MGLYKIPGVSSLGRWGYTRYQGSHHWGGGAIQDTRGLIPLKSWGYTRYQGSHHWGGGAIQDTRDLITGEVGLYKIPGVSSLGRWGYTRYQGSHPTGEVGGYVKVPSPQHAMVGP